MGRIARISFAAALLCCVSGASFADDYDWSGFYLGPQAGIGWDSRQIRGFTEDINQVSGINVPMRGVVIVPGTSVHVSGRSKPITEFLWGGSGGFAFQSGPYVFGAEGSVDPGSTSTSTSTYGHFDVPATALQAPSMLTVKRTMNTGLTWTARGRFGYAWDKVQLYATGGVAGRSMQVSGKDTQFAAAADAAESCPGGPGSNPCYPQVSNSAFSVLAKGSAHDNPIGWTIGAGSEWWLNDHLSLDIQAAHLDFGTHRFNLPSNNTVVQPMTVSIPGQTLATGAATFLNLSPAKVSLSENAITVAVHYRFNGLMLP